MTIPRCTSRIAHESGVVLRCQNVPTHDGRHIAGRERWESGDGREIVDDRPLVLVSDLRARRIALGLSQTAVARLMDTQQSAVSEMEAGLTVPMLSTFLRYADAVGLEVAVYERVVAAEPRERSETPN